MRRSRRWNVSQLICWIVLCIGSARPATSTAHAEEWILPDERLGVRTAPLLLLSRPDIQADLGLDRERIEGAQAMINELTRRAAALRGKAGAGVVAERRAIDEAQLQWLGKNLTGNQLERLRQVELQWEGASALLSRPSVAEYLRLTSEQRQTLARLIAERRRASASSAEDQAFHVKVQAALSQPQQELWKNLLGTPFRFASASVRNPNRDEATQRAGHVPEQP